MYVLNAWDLEAQPPWIRWIPGAPAEVRDSPEVAWSLLRASDAPKTPLPANHSEHTLPPCSPQGLLVLHGYDEVSLGDLVVVREYSLYPEAQ